MSKNDKIEKDDAGSKIALLPPAGAYAKQKHEFRALVQELKRLAFEHWYTQFDLGVPVGISVPTLSQRWADTNTSESGTR
jgi:hypothetical protein